MRLAGRILTAALLGSMAGRGSAQIAHSGPVATVTGVGNVLHIISDLNKELAFYRDTLGFKVQRQPRGPANDPTAYIPLLPVIAPMYLMAENAQYRSAEIFLATPATRLEMEDFKGQGPRAV